MPFSIRSQRVDVQLNDAVAETVVEQVFVNKSRRPTEGTYLFPVAENAGVHAFTMWMNGREVTGELLGADKARSIYESIVSKMRDPGLLQFAGRGLIQAKVFPIPAGGECRIKLRYTEPIVFDSGMAGYRFPLGTSGCRFRPIEQFALRATITSGRPLGGVFSPTHKCTVDRRNPKEVVVGFEQPRLQPEQDFQLYLRHADGQFGFTLLPYREAGGDGFFMARIAPKIGSETDAVLPKDVCFVLDTSGSMADDNKIAQAKKALKFCITNLGPQDRFRITTFATEVRSFGTGWRGADENAKAEARAFIDKLNAVGGTDINAALRDALPGPQAAATEKPTFVVFITDGEPTVGETDPKTILANALKANPARAARVFVLGVGFKVNTKLLDRLSDDHGGARGYVTPSEDLELKISSFYTKLANPVLANVELAFEGVSVHDVYPKRLPDVFQGSELVVLGRFASGGPGSAKVILKGTYRGEPRSFSFPCAFGSDIKHEYLPRVWAMRKIGYLLDQLRLHGETKEVKEEVIRLSKRYGILTPYTSFLVHEDERLARREGRTTVGRPMPSSIRGNFVRKRPELKVAAGAQAADAGEEAVDASRMNFKLRDMRAGKAGLLLTEVADEYRDDAGRHLINFVGSKTFYLESGRWVDAAYDGKAKTKKLVLYSPEYFRFLADNHSATACFAQGNAVLVMVNGTAIEVVPAKTDLE